jgi:hypothetical protein
MPPNLNYHEAASLSLAALTSWPSISRYSAAPASAKSLDAGWVQRDRDICDSIGKTY